LLFGLFYSMEGFRQQAMCCGSVGGCHSAVVPRKLERYGFDE
jgi:hypothetical protein